MLWEATLVVRVNQPKSARDRDMLVMGFVLEARSEKLARQVMLAEFDHKRCRILNMKMARSTKRVYPVGEA